MPGQPYHHGNLREALLDRAEQVIESDGVEALSLRQLARDLGVSHAAPARHFRDRAHLLQALAVRGFGAMNALLSRAAGVGGEVEPDYGRRLGALAHAYVRFAVEHPALLSVMYATKHAAPPVPDAAGELQSGDENAAPPGREAERARLAVAAEQGMRLVAELIGAAQRAGCLHPGDPELLARSAFAGVHGVATLVSGAMVPPSEADELTDVLVGLLWAGMGGSTDRWHGVSATVIRADGGASGRMAP